MRLPARTRVRAHARPLALVGVLLACALATTSAGGATSTTVVSMNVPSAISLTNNCTSTAAYRFGTVQPGTPAITDNAANACRFTFTSSNDTAMLRVYQRDNNASNAMGSLSTSVIDQDGGAGYNTTYELDMFDSSNGYAGGNGGRLFRTTDGATWNSVATGTGMTFRGVEAVSSTIVIGVGSSGILRSTTGGTSWTTVFNNGQTIHDIDHSGGTYWAVGGSGTIVTSADGITWTPQASGVTSNLESVDAVSGSVALAAGGNTILRYDGTSWSTRATGVSAGYEVSGWSATGLAIATGNWGEIRRSTDGGVTWSAALFGPSPGMADAGVIHRGALTLSNTEAVVSGLRGQILRSTDSGATWTELPTPTRNMVRSLAADPSGTRWFAVGGGEVLAETSNWSTWTTRRRLTTLAALYDVTAIDAQNAYAVGAHGFIRRTSDGTSWTTPASPTSEHLWAVDSTDSGVGYAVGDNGTVLRTATGATWTAVTPTGAHQLRGVAAIDDTTVVAVGTSGVIARSTDAGTTWTISTPTANWFSSVSSFGDRVVAVGNLGTVFVSSDRGASWVNRTAVSGTTTPLRDVSVATDQTIYAISKWENQSRRSSDGGTTWQLWTGANAGNGGYSVSAPAADVAWHVMYDDNYVRTLDGGATATTQASAVGFINWAIAAVDSNVAFIVGEDGGIGKTQVVAASVINDYGGANVWGNAATPSLFGVCLQSVTGATSDWTAAAAPPCGIDDGDPWRTLPPSASKVAHTTTAGASGTITLVWGFRPALNTPPGTYSATALVEAIAPDA